MLCDPVPEPGFPNVKDLLPLLDRSKVSKRHLMAAGWRDVIGK
jgi:hypothetical protein